MPEGAVHYQVWSNAKQFVLGVYAAGEICVSAYRVLYPGWYSEHLWVMLSQVYIWGALFYLCGQFVDPDLDQLGVTQADGRLMRIPFFGHFLMSYWNFYASMMALAAKVFNVEGMFGSAHRSWLTHSIFPGTQIRCLFFNAPIYLLLTYIKNRYGLPGFVNLTTILAFLGGQIMGLSAADWLHCKMDELN